MPRKSSLSLQSGVCKSNLFTVFSVLHKSTQYYLIRSTVIFTHKVFYLKIWKLELKQMLRFLTQNDYSSIKSIELHNTYHTHTSISSRIVSIHECMKKLHLLHFSSVIIHGTENIIYVLCNQMIQNKICLGVSTVS